MRQRIPLIKLRLPLPAVMPIWLYHGWIRRLRAIGGLPVQREMVNIEVASAFLHLVFQNRFALVTAFLQYSH